MFDATLISQVLCFVAREGCRADSDLAVHLRAMISTGWMVFWMISMAPAGTPESYHKNMKAIFFSGKKHKRHVSLQENAAKLHAECRQGPQRHGFVAFGPPLLQCMNATSLFFRNVAVTNRSTGPI
jgi:hypothetical protein